MDFALGFPQSPMPWILCFPSRATLLLGDPHVQMLTSSCSGTMSGEFPKELGLVAPAGASLGEAVGAIGSPHLTPFTRPGTHAQL